jgi:hypothetical protein
MRVAACTVLGLLGFGIASSRAADDAQFAPVQTYKGICEPSGALGVPEGSIDRMFIVANDQDNTLRAYRPNGGGVEMPSGNLNKFLNLHPEDNEDDKVDFEAATWLNGKAYWIGSHSRSGKGRLREQRWQFFGTRVSMESDKPTLTPTSQKSYGGLLATIAALDPRLAQKIRLDDPRDEDLAPDNGGFNIEGLTARANGKSMLIGLRSPLFSDKAVLIPFENPEAVGEKSEKPVLGHPIELDLGGRGVRSIEYSAAAKAYFILAGPAGGQDGSFDLYRWPAEENAAPTIVPGFAAALKKLGDFQPEAMVVDSEGKNLHLFSDDGDNCKKANPTFRSVAVTLP